MQQTNNQPAADNEMAYYIKSVGKHSVLTRSEEYELLVAVQKGSEEAKAAAMEILVTHNQGLIIKIAKKYKDKGVPLVDLVVEGNIGLITAIRKFDLTQDNKLSTYAAWWIREKITRCISNESRAIRLPVYKCEKSSKIRSGYMEFMTKNGYPPTNEELSEATGVSLKEIDNLFGLSILDPISLDSSTATDDLRTVGETLVSNEANPIDDISRQTIVKNVWEALGKLTEEEQFIIKNKFGLVDKVFEKDEVIKTLGIDEKKLRSMTRKAMNKLACELEGPTHHIVCELHGTVGKKKKNGGD